MGREVGWTDLELSHFARGQIYDSEDGIAVVDKTKEHFGGTTFAKYKTPGPTTGAHKSYCARYAKLVKAKFDKIAAVVKKFRKSLRFICAAQPSGVTENEVLSMEIGKHLRNRDGKSYDARSYPHAEQKFHLTYKVLRFNPKFVHEGSMSGAAPSHQQPSEPFPDAKDSSTPAANISAPDDVIRLPSHGDSDAPNSSQGCITVLSPER